MLSPRDVRVEIGERVLFLVLRRSSPPARVSSEGMVAYLDTGITTSTIRRRAGFRSLLFSVAIWTPASFRACACRSNHDFGVSITTATWSFPQLIPSSTAFPFPFADDSYKDGRVLSQNGVSLSVFARVVDW